MSRRLLILTFISVIVVGALHRIGSAFYLYWDVVWFDGLVHYVGALSVGFLFLWVWYVSGLFGRSTPSRKEVFISSLIAVMAVALGWEFFEYSYGIAVSNANNYVLDTFHDVVFDFLGALTVGLVGRVRSFYE
ncbi:hypothetical protein KW800_01495 [Candidatus Parcubacteria bacterium]|nr:hypothetical protein [Candidatus Parcubacteria bacterium]